MSTIDQKTYLLNKYLKGPSKEKKKKKRKIKGKGLCIIDDDIDTSKLQHLSGDEIEALGLDGEDAPQIAGIVDERPDHIKEMERFNANKWRVIAENDGTGSTLRVEEIHRDQKKLKQENTLIFGKMYSDSEEEQKSDSDISLPRKNSANVNKHVNSSKEKLDKNLSPSRHQKKLPSREDRKDKSRMEDSHNDINPENRRNHSADSVLPPRISKTNRFKRDHGSEDDSNFSPELSRKDQCKSSKRYASLKSESKQGSDSDLSPPRKSSSVKDKDKSTRHDDSDLSPPTKSKQKKTHYSSKYDIQSNYDSDVSPPRKSSHKYNSRSGMVQNSDADLSPSRKEEAKRKKKKKPSRWGYFEPEKSKNSDSDLSPPRRNTKERSKSPAKRYSRTQGKSEEPNRKYRRRSDNSPPSKSKKMEKTLEGKKAGLQSARGMRDEAAELRRREDDLYDKMAPEVSGRAATAVNRRLGKRESSAEKEKNKEREARQKEMDEKYSKWNRGLKQVSDERQRQADFLHEASKPVARTRDDADLERALKAVQRDGDPMLEYLRTKTKDDTPQRPTYKGSFPPNRFNVRPGYRWDGVDRSNGYETKLFDSRSRATALLEDAYKWSTEDL